MLFYWPTSLYLLFAELFKDAQTAKGKCGTAPSYIKDT
jgi:hypothetical protein